MSWYHDDSAGSLYESDAGFAGVDVGAPQDVVSYSNYQQPQMQQAYPGVYQRQLAVYGADEYRRALPPKITTQHLGQHQHLPTISSSSGSTNFRSSDNSSFSQWHTRDSMASAASPASSWPHASDFSREQYDSEAEDALTPKLSTRQRPLPRPRESPISPTPSKRCTQRQPVQERDYFKSCVSTNKQSRPCNREQKYFCTICEKSFVSKADWKRHEETYQERTEKFQCDNCPAIYFLDKDFVAHHVKSHQCATCADNVKCSLKRHVQAARQRRMARTGWGCGFCTHFSGDWTERCNHIAYHIEKEGKTASNWYHSKVIYSLLQRPAIQVEWCKLLESRQERDLTIGWNQRSTGRTEGYPESNPRPQLQDLLEYFTQDQNPAPLALLAFEKLKLPPPPVPHKDHRKTSLEDLTNTLDPWTQMMDGIISDPMMASGVEFPEDLRVEL
ncbi:hypothetical protein NX059_008915 [Plenodomus lindquistii]|nr:hypothetical protein NX059_008915 [Plenodomus lindquistii]